MDVPGTRTSLPDPAMPHVTVLVPYFQRERGLLRRALESIARQTVLHEDAPMGDVPSGEPPVEILLVDDGSPVPAEDEVEGLEIPERLSLRIVHRENGGVCASRNTGLDVVDPRTKLLAMLDSDDVWSEDHLERAIKAHALGAAIYTANWIPIESDLDAITFFRKLDLADHRPVPEIDDAFEFVGDFTAQEFEKSIARPSALVFDWQLFGDLRIDERLVYSSEDQYWRLQMAARRPRVIFSSQVEVRSGRGVNHFSSLQWATERNLLALRDRIYCAHLASRTLPLDPEARRARRRMVSSTRTDLMGTLIHLMRRGPRPALSTLVSILRRDPAMGIVWPKHSARILAQRLGPG